MSELAKNSEQIKMVKLADYIEHTDERNVENKYSFEEVKGISTEKKFITTKANLDGVSLTKYKVVHKDELYMWQTSRAEKIALA